MAGRYFCLPNVGQVLADRLRVVGRSLADADRALVDLQSLREINDADWAHKLERFDVLDNLVTLCTSPSSF